MRDHAVGEGLMERAALTQEQFAHLWATAPSVEDIGRQAGISVKLATRLARKYGLPARPRGQKRAKTVDVPLLFELWNRNVEVRRIAEALGVRESYVSKLAARFKLPDRRANKVWDNEPRPDDPTPEQIAERAAWCRARRQEVTEPDRVEIKAYHYDSHTGLFTGLDAWVA